MAQTADARRNHRTLWRVSSAIAVSALGDGMHTVALPLETLRLTSSATAIATVAAVGWLPWLLFGSIGGAVADRWSRRTVVVIVDGARALLLGLVVWLIATGHATVWLLASVNFLLTVGDTMVSSALHASIPSTVDDDAQRVQDVTRRLFAAETVTRNLVGPTLGAVLFQVDPYLPFLVDGASFAFSSVALLGARLGRRDRSPDARRATTAWRAFAAEVREGWRTVLGEPVLRSLALGSALFNLSVTMADTVVVLYLRDTLAVSPSYLGLLLGCEALGGVAASTLGSSIWRRVEPGRLLRFSLLGAAVAIGLVAARPGLALLAVLLASVAACTTVWSVTADTLRQTTVKDELRARVLSTSRSLSWGAIPLGAMLAGVLTDWAGLAWVYLIAAAVSLLAFVLLSVLRSRSSETR
jgi:MFS family permease